MDFFKLSVWVYVVILIVALIIDYFIAKQFEDIAEEKGFSQKRNFWIPFFFGLVGWIMVAALPDRGKQTVEVSEPQK